MLPSLNKFIGADQLVQLPLNKLQEMESKIKNGANLNIPLDSIEDAIKIRKHVDLTQQAEQAANELNNSPPDVDYLIKGISSIPMPDNALRMAAGGIVAFSGGESVKNPKQAFIEEIRPFAEKIAEEKGIPVEVILTQAALESGWGKSRPGNNLFGIKAGPGWTGPSNMLATKEFIDGKMVDTQGRFRAYDSPEGSLRDWSKVMDQPNFRSAIEASRNNPMAFPAAIARTNYATDPNYGQKSMGVMREVQNALGQNPQNSWKENLAGPSQFAYRTLSPEGAKRGIGAAAVAPREESPEDEYLRQMNRLRADQRKTVNESREYYEGRRKEIKDPTAPDEEKIRRDMDARAEARDRPMIEAMRAQAAGMRPNEEAAKRRAFQNFLIEGGAAMADPRSGGRGIAGALQAFTQAASVGNRAYEREMTVMEAAKQKAMEAEQKVNEAQYKAVKDRDAASEAAVTNAMREYRTDMNGIKSLRTSLDAQQRAELTQIARDTGFDINALRNVAEAQRKAEAAAATAAAKERAAEEKERGRVAAAENKTLASQVQSVQKLVSDATVKDSFGQEWKKLEREFRKQRDAGQQPTPLPRKEAWVLEKVLAANPNLFPDAASFAEAARKVSGRPEPQQPTAPAAPTTAPTQQRIIPLFEKRD
jgi:hypothetical protein